MRYGFITLLFYLCFGLYNCAVAQQQIFKNYTVNDGLVSNSVRRIFQDAKGFLWIATWEGLSKYDGYAFTNFSTANGLSHNLVNDMYEGSNSKLFVALNNGNIDVIADNIITAKARPVQPTVNRFLAKPGHPVMVAMDTKGLRIFKDGNIIDAPQKFSAETLTDITWLNDSLLIATTDSCVKIITNGFELYATTANSASTFIEAKVYKDSKQRIWVGTYKGLQMLTGIPEKNQSLLFTTLPPPFNIASLKQKRINDILEDGEGNMWFGTNGGLVKINPAGLHQLITVKDGLASNIVTCIFQDKEKNIWVGTAVGLSKLITKSSITLYPIDGGVASNDNTYLLCSFNKENILVGTSGGVQIFNKLSGAIKPVTALKRQPAFSAVQYATPPALIEAHNIVTFNTTTLKYSKRIPLPATNTIRMAVDKQGYLFSSDLTRLIFSSNDKQQKILDCRTSALLIDKLGSLWAGTWQQGLYCLRYQCIGDKLQVLQLTHYFPNENIRCLYEDSEGNIWAGTRYNGVYKITKNAKRFSFTNYNQSKGLGSNFIKGIREDKKGNIWIAFYQGIDKLVPHDKGCQIFNFSRVNNYFTSIIGMEIDDDNSLWLATGEGLTHIKDGELEKLPPSPVYITKMYSPDSVYPLTSNTIQLNHRQNQLQFEFSAPGFINERQIMYSYRLVNGSQDQWTTGSNQHVVSYASLQPGSYTFEVRSLGWNNKWSKPATITFVISPPFWQQWWFGLLCVSMVVLTTYAIIKKELEIYNMLQL